MNIESTLWTEKYRPTTLSEYVFSNPQQKSQIEKWVKEQDIPHILAYGSPGTGKSTIAKVLINELHIDPYDVLWINASRERNIDTMRDRITSFASTIPFGRMRIVVLDEADFMNPNSSQPMLRGIMEQYSATTRFILTLNYVSKILPAIHSRTQSLYITKMDITDFTVKMAEILVAENVDFELETLDLYVKETYPDLRKCINNCQLNCISGKLILAEINASNSSSDYKIDAIELFKAGKIREARQLICSQIRVEELNEFFVFLYNNLDLFGKTDKQKDEAILIIRKGLVQIPLVADAEILISAVLIELGNIE
jgi:DNA polymerase III delta prime subunit